MGKRGQCGGTGASGSPERLGTWWKEPMLRWAEGSPQVLLGFMLRIQRKD